jgi:hypothetical protein
MATVIQVIDIARDYLKDPLASTRSFPDNTSSFFKDSTLLNFYNQAQQRIQNKLVQSFENWLVTSTSVSLVNGQEGYSLPSDMLKVVRIEDVQDTTSPVPLTPMSLNDKDDVSRGGVWVNLTSTRSVTNYAIKGKSFIVRPIPNINATNALKIYYSKRLPDFSSASSVSELPLEYHELLALGIVRRALIQQEASTEAIAVIRAEYNDLFREMTTTAEDRQVQRSRHVKFRKHNRRGRR